MTTVTSLHVKFVHGEQRFTVQWEDVAGGVRYARRTDLTFIQLLRVLNDRGLTSTEVRARTAEARARARPGASPTT